MIEVSHTGVLIVGAGQAGANAAAALRDFGYQSRILLVGEEQSPPYERPPLSKGMLAGSCALGEILVHPAGFHEEKAIDVLLGTSVSALVTGTHCALLSNGTSVEYEHCLLATGGRARIVTGLPTSAPRVHYLRSMSDALRLREELRQRHSVLIVGGGFLGLEVASTARSMGLAVTVLENADRVLGRVVPPAMSTWLQQRISQSGVELRLKTRCDSFQIDPSGVTATLASGESVFADLVVVAVGLEPNVGLARDAGIGLHPLNGGIRVDERCATNAPDIYAAGDCASQFHSALGTEVRLESWQNANEQARLVAAAISGVTTKPLTSPWFWSDQFGINLQILGVPTSALQYHCRGEFDDSSDAPKFLLLGADNAGRIRHVIAINSGGDLRPLKPLVDGMTPCEPLALCDVSLPLRQQVRAAVARTSSPAIS